VAEACAEAGAALVIAHTRVPPKQKSFPHYSDVMEDVIGLLSERIEEAGRRGVKDEQLILDPGLDLAKTPAQSVELLRRLPELGALGYPILIAASRKDFVGALTGRAPAERDAGTLAALDAAVEGGASILRVHDVAGARDYLAVRDALHGARDVPHLDESLRREPDAA
jgi:dihydropteroate synthase